MLQRDFLKELEDNSKNTRPPLVPLWGFQHNKIFLEKSHSNRKTSIIDVPLRDIKFIWSDGHENPFFAHIDRFFLHGELEDSSPYLLIQRLSRVVSDHMPLLLNTETVTPPTQTFRFEIFWTLNPELKPLIMGWWEEPIVEESNTFRVWNAKIKHLQAELRNWLRLSMMS